MFYDQHGGNSDTIDYPGRRTQICETSPPKRYQDDHPVPDTRLGNLLKSEPPHNTWTPLSYSSTLNYLNVIVTCLYFPSF